VFVFYFDERASFMLLLDIYGKRSGAVTSVRARRTRSRAELS